jgi:hypothetical protein
LEIAYAISTIADRRLLLIDPDLKYLPGLLVNK